MISLLRAGVAAALLAVAPLVVPQAAGAAVQKAFQNSELAESAIALEAQIKSDAGTPTKPLPQIRRDADAAFSKNDFRSGMALLGQIVAAAPNDSATWLRLARTVMQIRPADDSEKRCCSSAPRPRPTSPISARPVAPRKPTASPCSATCWPSASCGGRRSMRCGSRSNCAKPPTCAGNMSGCAKQHGFRVLDYSVDADTASPRACFQFSEDLPPRTDFSPFVGARRHRQAGFVGRREAALRRGIAARRELQRHPARRLAVDRAREAVEVGGLFDLCARPQAAVRFSSTAYVLPRTGQRGIPVISVNTACGRGRNLPHRRPQPGGHDLGNEDYGRGDFQTQPEPLRRRAAAQLARRRGVEGRARRRSRRRSMPTSPPPFRSIRRSASSSPASM